MVLQQHGSSKAQTVYITTLHQLLRSPLPSPCVHTETGFSCPRCPKQPTPQSLIYRYHPRSGFRFQLKQSGGDHSKQTQQTPYSPANSSLELLSCSQNPMTWKKCELAIIVSVVPGNF
ncbi:hypothetical protein CROQUDRAFT_286554 [Cronartium quercuum f. sp. fusiforme G11]|uniref:Uncharacterized protein n=1 Tax=Cronartium quercuum f. sp. fusiforme G11 TaxID=708437 RepID=A0A9P6T7E4_9BASI|nr:hypothetical protein CROQUDRAFT_286554 [Cronartium quercuum f. sp. fusiforme G11]